MPAVLFNRAARFVLLAAISSAVVAAEPVDPKTEQASQELWKKIAPQFQPAESPAGSNALRSPLIKADGTRVTDAAGWKARRAEILADWHQRMGAWPAVIEKPKVEVLEETKRGEIIQRKLRFDLAPGKPTDAYLLVPPGEGKRPAMLVVFYDAETPAGLNPKAKEGRDFGWQLAQRGFVTLNVGRQPLLTGSNDIVPEIQPLSAMAYAAANAWHVMAAQPEIDPARIGVMGHSYGGKWAMFASCLYDKFAVGVWSDGGIVFDEPRSNVNYWEPWYLGFEEGKHRKRGLVTEDNPRTGPYRQMIADGRNLHELHVLMAPRPFLVSGGSEDPPARWQALGHSLEVNKLLGHTNRVAMTNRPAHDPSPESNEQLALFLEYFLKQGHALEGAAKR